MKNNWEWQKQMESDLSGLLMNCHSGKKTLSFHFPHFILLPWWRSVCLHESAACVFVDVSYVCFQLQEWTKACMSMVRYPRGEIFSLFAMCDYINADFRVTQEQYFFFKCLSPEMSDWVRCLPVAFHHNRKDIVCFCFMFMGKYWESPRSPATHGFHTASLWQLHCINWLTHYGNC